MKSRLSRRKFLIVSSAALSGLVASAQQADSAGGSDSDGEIFGGQIRGIDPAKKTIEVESASGTRLLKVTEHAVLNRDGTGHALDDFKVGDRVVIETPSLRPESKSTRVSALSTEYRFLAGEVLSVTADHLLVEGGQVQMASDTAVHLLDNASLRLKASDIIPGRRVAIDAMLDPASKEWVARRVGVAV